MPNLNFFSLKYILLWNRGYRSSHFTTMPMAPLPIAYLVALQELQELHKRARLCRVPAEQLHLFMDMQRLADFINGPVPLVNEDALKEGDSDAGG